MCADIASPEEMRAAAERYLALCDEYTDPYEREKLIRDWQKKENMATSVVGDFERRAESVYGKRVLDIGFGNGFYAIAFARAGASVSGLEVNAELEQIAREHLARSKVEADLRLYDGEHFPFESDSFDCAYSISVIEHVSDARAVLSEIARVLKPGGTFYLAFPNRWTPRETHTGLYFLGYLPRDVAAFVLTHFFGRNSIQELNLHFLSYWTLRRLLKGLPLSLRFEHGGNGNIRRLLKRSLGAFGIHHSAILSTVMLVLEKPL